MKFYRSSFFIILLAVVVSLTGWFSVRHQAVSKNTIVNNVSPSGIRATIVSPISSAISPSPSYLPSSTPSIRSDASTKNNVSLNVPFTIQAPDGQWVEPWAEGCEEAALLMADAYYSGNYQITLPVAETKTAIQKMVDWQIKRFGSHKDLGTDEMAIVAKEYLGYGSVIVKHNATVEDIKNELRDGSPVIVPAAGHLLQNPHFKQPGPPYHVFLIKGFEGDTFIANENGTRFGKDYTYSASTLTFALHDLQAGKELTETPMAYLVLK